MYRDRTQYHAERRQSAHDETHSTLINHVSTYEDVMRIVSHPTWSLRSKAGMLRSYYADTRDYNGAIIGRYANFTQIVKDEMTVLKPMTLNEWRAKYQKNKLLS